MNNFFPALEGGNAQQVRLCQKVYKLASDLEKNKLLEEKRAFRETQE